jgi:hypothetical protein
LCRVGQACAVPPGVCRGLLMGLRKLVPPYCWRLNAPRRTGQLYFRPPPFSKSTTNASDPSKVQIDLRRRAESQAMGEKGLAQWSNAQDKEEHQKTAPLLRCRSTRTCNGETNGTFCFFSRIRGRRRGGMLASRRNRSAVACCHDTLP